MHYTSLARHIRKRNIFSLVNTERLLLHSYACYMHHILLQCKKLKSCWEITSEFSDTNSLGDKPTIVYCCHKENTSYQKPLTPAAVLVPLSQVIY